MLASEIIQLLQMSYQDNSTNHNLYSLTPRPDCLEAADWILAYKSTSVNII